MNKDSLLPRLWVLPAAIRARVGREPGPQRAMLEEGHLLIILHEMPGGGECARRAALFWRSPDGVWNSNQQGNGLASLFDHVAGYERELGELETRGEMAETAADYREILARVAPLLRASRGMHRALQQARELVKEDRDLINLRDHAVAVERTAEHLLHDAEFGLNFTVARQAEEQAESARQMAASAYRLNFLAAFFLPITTITSLFGMNLQPGISDSPTVFWGVAGAGAALGGCFVFLLGGPRRGAKGP